MADESEKAQLIIGKVEFGPTQDKFNKRMRSTHTYTYVLLEVSDSTYDEIHKKLKEAEYQHLLHEDGVIDMHDIALVRYSTSRKSEPTEG